jgi:diketogulonate reductase-like aldo/keto reductase
MKHLTVQGREVPAIGLGTWLLSGAECVAAVARALTTGYRHVDTAQDYGNEAEVGEGIRRSGVRREEIFLTTKVRPTEFSYHRTIRSTRQSLARLRTEYVDLLLMHWPNPRVPLAETLGAMLALQAEGRVRHVGVSNFPPSLVAADTRYAPIFCHQVEYHPYLSQERLIVQAAAMGHLVTAYSPLAKGRVFSDPEIQGIADSHGKTPGQVTLRWIVQQGLAAIPKAMSEEHQRANLAVFDFALSEDEMGVLYGLARGLRLDPVSKYSREK